MSFSHIRRFFREYLSEGNDSSSSINPNLLAIAIRGYRIQSDLGIPDSWGFLPPLGNARFQAHQAAAWMMLLTVLVLTVPLQVLVVVLTASKGFGVAHFLGHCAIWAAVDAAMVGFLWMMVLMERRSAVEFRLKDWKLRQD